VGSRSVTIKAAWIMGISAIITAVIGGVFLLISNQPDVSISNNGTGTQVLGNVGTINNNTKQSKSAYLDLLEETDIHLGDNVYPDEYGVSYNPLTQDIYPQPLKGVVFFDKETNNFLADGSGQTQIGQYLVNKIESYIVGIDFSSYKHIIAINSKDSKYTELINNHKDSNSIVYLGPTVLIADINQTGNYYNRFAAVGFTQSFDLTSLCRNAGISRESRDLKVSVIIKSYHGGIRTGQSENFYLILNNFESKIPSITTATNTFE